MMFLKFMVIFFHMNDLYTSKLTFHTSLKDISFLHLCPGTKRLKVSVFYLCWYVRCHIVDEVWTPIIS